MKYFCSLCIYKSVQSPKSRAAASYFMSMVEVLCDRKLFAWLAQHRGKKKHAERGKTHISLRSFSWFSTGTAEKKLCELLHSTNILYKIDAKLGKNWRKKFKRYSKRTEVLIRHFFHWTFSILKDHTIIFGRLDC